MTKTEFIKAVAGYVQKYASGYGIKVHSPIIAQAILESGWGKSKLAANYHNYFGLKCGTKWTGKSVNMTTQEEYTAGTLTTIKDNFRVYDSIEDGVKGYFEFIQLSRYSNLKGITDPRKYLETIKADGYATSSAYVENNMKLVNQYGLTVYDPKGETSMSDRQKPVNYLKQYIGIKEGSTEHKAILAVFNNSGLCTRYKMTTADAWCATAVSAAFIATGLSSIFPCVECSCANMITKAKSAGIWKESDSYAPSVGDVILYDWQDSGSGDNTGNPDHVGIVASVSGSTFKVIEGNISNTVGYRSMTVNGKYIRGYILPKYSGSTSGSTTTSGSGNTTYSGKGIGTATAKVVMNIRAGAGTSYKSYGTIAKGTAVEVLEKLSSGWYKIVWPGASGGYAYTSNASGKYYTYTAKTASSSSAKAEAAQSFSKSLAKTYTTTVALNLRSGAGTGKKVLLTIPKGKKVQCYGYYTTASGVKWLYVVYNGTTGFCSSKYLK